MRQRYRYIPVYDIVRELGPFKASELPAFHALTGCDTNSAFFGKGKKTAWSVWLSLPELTLPLRLLSSPNPTQEVIKTHKNVLERFVLQLDGVYEEEITTEDATKLYLFQHKGSDLSRFRQVAMLCISTSLEWPIRVDMYGVIHSINLQIQCLQRIWDVSNKLRTLRTLQFIPRFPSFR